MHRAFTHRESLRRVRPAPGLVGLVTVTALSALLLAGCGAGSANTGTQGRLAGGTSAQDSAGTNGSPGAKGAPGVAPGAKAVPDAQVGPGAQPGPAEVPKPGAPTVVGVGPKLTRTASLDLQVKDIYAAAARVRSIATGLQAQVLSEQIGNGGPGPLPPMPPTPLPDQRRLSSVAGDPGGFGTLTLSVPADQLDTALDQLAKDVGTVLRRNTSSQDVTSQYVDTESRLKTMRASLDRVRALMARATDIGQVVALESEMSRREADLESMESQLAALKTSVERATLTVSLSTPNVAKKPVATNGFIAGLHSGWNAFTASASGLFTAIGAMLPFALFFALLGAPLVWWLRRRTKLASPAVVNP